MDLETIGQTPGNNATMKWQGGYYNPRHPPQLYYSTPEPGRYKLVRIHSSCYSMRFNHGRPQAGKGLEMWTDGPQPEWIGKVPSAG